MDGERPTSQCSECGALLAAGRLCRDYFHDLLVLEMQVPGAAGAEPHFLAVAAYNLQHPSGFMPGALASLHQTVADVLAGRATLREVRRRARRAANGPTRVVRHATTVLPAVDVAVLHAWPTQWTMTVRDVSEVAPERYVERVRAWAIAVTAALDVAVGRSAAGERAG